MRNDVQRALVEWVRSEEPGLLRAVFSFSADQPFFRGHFPHKPLVPGMFQVEMVRSTVEASTGHRHAILEVGKAKFKGEISPGDRILVEASTCNEANVIHVRATLRVENDLVATISMDLVRRL